MILFVYLHNIFSLCTYASVAYDLQVIKLTTQNVQIQPASVLATPLAVFVRLSIQRNNSMPQRTAPTGPTNALTRQALSFATAVYSDGD